MAGPTDYTIKWNSPLNISAAGVIIAAADGFFAREGLTTSLVSGTDDAATLADVAKSDHMIGQVSAHSFLRARAAGLPVIAFATSYSVSSVQLYALSKTPLDGPADLAGKRIWSPVNSDAWSTLEAIIVRYAVPRSALKVEDASATVAQLRDGTVDVLPGHWEIEGEDLRKQQIPYRILDPEALGIHTLGTVYATSATTLERRPDIAERFLSALFKGWDGAYKDYNRTSPIIAAAIEQHVNPADIVKLMDGQRRYVRPLGSRMGESDLARWRELQDQLLRQRTISKPVDLAYAINFSVVDEIYRSKLKALTIDR